MRTFEELMIDASEATKVHDTAQIDACSAEFAEIGTPRSLAMSEYTKGIARSMQSRFQSSAEHFRRALAMFTELEGEQYQAIVLTRLGGVSYRSDDNKQALDYWQRSLALAEKIGHKAAIANATCNIGGVYIEWNDVPKAFEQFSKALSMHTELGMKLEMGHDLTGIGTIHSNIGDYPEAISCFHRVLAVYTELGYRHGVAVTTDRIGNALFHMEQHSEALEHYTKSLHVFEELDMRLEFATTIGHIGSTYARNHNYALAQEYFERAIELNKELDRPVYAFDSMNNLVSLLCEQGRFDEAEQWFNSIIRDGPSRDGAQIYYEINRAVIQDHHGNHDEAVDILKTALEIASISGSPVELMDLHKTLRDMALAHNNLAAYVEHNNEFVRIKEQINGKDTAARLAIHEAERKMAAERAEHEKHLSILHSTLPKTIADRVARGESVSDLYDQAAVLFADVVGFTTHSATMTAPELAALLDQLFTRFDDICKQHHVVKVKTIGDAYLCFKGDGTADENAIAVGSTALELLHAGITWPDGEPITLRIGLHSGPVTAGVLGTERLQYDIWGDTVNTASRMESTSEPGKIHVSEALANALNEALNVGSRLAVTLLERGTIDVKGKGMMKTYWLE